MLTIRPFWSLLLLLSLTLSAHAKPAPTPKDTPAVAVVRQFLADRAAGKLDAAYMLLSADSHQMGSEADFAKGSTLSPNDKGEYSAAFYGLLTLFGDTHNTQHYTFTVLGPDPAAPGGVLVKSVSPTGITSTLQMATVTDPGTPALRLDFLGSAKRTDPVQFARSAEQAKEVTSQSNLRQLSLGIIQYALDHDNHLPDADKWMDEVMPYVKEKALFRDPSAPAGEEYSYAFNRTLSHQPLAALDIPATTVLLFESTAGLKNASDTGQSVPKPGWHLGGTDYAFADGHVKWLQDGTAPSFALTGK